MIFVAMPAAGAVAQVHEQIECASIGHPCRQTERGERGSVEHDRFRAASSSAIPPTRRWARRSRSAAADRSRFSDEVRGTQSMSVVGRLGP